MVGILSIATFLYIIVACAVVATSTGSKKQTNTINSFFKKVGSAYTRHVARSSSSSSSSSSDTTSSPRTSYDRVSAIRRRGRAAIPPIALFVLASLPTTCKAHHLNKQPLVIKSPFFQGWLVRVTDHSQKRSFILIVGSFSSRGSGVYDQHYIFCGIDSHGGGSGDHEAFPDSSTVTVSAPPPDSSKLCVTWAAENIGYFRYTDDDCSGKFVFSDGLTLEFNSTDRRPWDSSSDQGGPEGWLSRAPPQLLPCHYYVHSTGSRCAYKVRQMNGDEMAGVGFAHIEGNYGKATGVANAAALSLVGGLFDIGLTKSMNFIVYLRINDSPSPTSSSTDRTEKVFIFRTTDLNSIKYDIDGIKGGVTITAVNSKYRLELTIKSKALYSTNTGSVSRDFGNAIYIPTGEGFKNQPGCRETYSAVAEAKCYERTSGKQALVASETFDMAALEFGGSFLGIKKNNYI